MPVEHVIMQRKDVNQGIGGYNLVQCGGVAAQGNAFGLPGDVRLGQEVTDQPVVSCIV